MITRSHEFCAIVPSWIPACMALGAVQNRYKVTCVHFESADKDDLIDRAQQRRSLGSVMKACYGKLDNVICEDVLKRIGINWDGHFPGARRSNTRLQCAVPAKVVQIATVLCVELEWGRIVLKQLMLKVVQRYSQPRIVLVYEVWKREFRWQKLNIRRWSFKIYLK